MTLDPGADAPTIPGLVLEPGPGVLMFYKVTCPTCQMAGPVAEKLFARFPGRFAAVAQDPPDRIEDFGRRYGTSFPSLSEPPPYDASNAYDVEAVPTLYLLDGGRIVDVVESWDREGWNRVAGRLGEMTGQGGGAVSEEGDGLPPFRPG